VNPAPDDLSGWFAAEVQPHESALRGWLRQQFPQLSDIDDIVQEAFARVLRARSRGPVTTPRALLFTTARHVAIDLLRRNKVVSFEPLTELRDLAVYDDGPGVAESAARRQELEILTHAIQSLPDRCRQVLTLRKIYGLSQKEIAAELGISEHTVEVQVANGMRRCANFLALHGLP
jgi:RNA polymerase sigma factor (sigma-70 family)